MPNLIFNEEAHTYHLDGVRIPCVTDIIGMLTDFSFVPADILERASAFGTAVHRAVELYENDDLVESSLSPALVPYLDQYKKFKDETGFIAGYTEERVYSKIYGYAGTLDLAGVFESMQQDRAVIDIKAVSVLHPAVGLQLAAYKNAFTESWPSNKLKASVRRFALQLKEKSYRLVEYTDKNDFATFVACVTLHNWRMNNETKHRSRY